MKKIIFPVLSIVLFSCSSAPASKWDAATASKTCFDGATKGKYDFILMDNQQMIVNFFLSEGDFFSVRTTLKNKQTVSDHFVYGVSFDDISIALKRQIRSYVASKKSS